MDRAGFTSNDTSSNPVQIAYGHYQNNEILEFSFSLQDRE